MAGRVHADPTEIRDFAGEVETFVENTQAELEKLRKRFDDLEWDDDARRHIADLLEESAGRFKPLSDKMSEIPPKLRNKAQKLAEYLEAG